MALANGLCYRRGVDGAARFFVLSIGIAGSVNVGKYYYLPLTKLKVQNPTAATVGI